MGELHLEIIVDRLLREFKVEANVGAPQVAYKRDNYTNLRISTANMQNSPVDADSTDTVKLNSSQWMQTVRRHTPLSLLLSGGSIPKEYIPAVDEGIQDAMKSGILGGFPVVGVHANCYDGSYHEVDSSEMAFHIAGSLAFKDAMKQGSSGTA